LIIFIKLTAEHAESAEKTKKIIGWLRQKNQNREKISLFRTLADIDSAVSAISAVKLKMPAKHNNIDQYMNQVQSWR